MFQMIIFFILIKTISHSHFWNLYATPYNTINKTLNEIPLPTTYFIFSEIIIIINHTYFTREQGFQFIKYGIIKLKFDSKINILLYVRML